MTILCSTGSGSIASRPSRSTVMRTSIPGSRWAFSRISSGRAMRPASSIVTVALPFFTAAILQRQPVRHLHQEHVVRRGGRYGAEVAADAERADGGDVGAVLVPGQVQRRSGAELPAHDGASAHAAEVEVGVAEGVGVGHVVGAAGTDQGVIVVVVAGGDER